VTRLSYGGAWIKEQVCGRGTRRVGNFVIRYAQVTSTALHIGAESAERCSSSSCQPSAPITIGQLMMRLVPPAAGIASSQRAIMALVAHSTVRRSTLGVCLPDAPSAATRAFESNSP
jgi:hypothetical protein